MQRNIRKLYRNLIYSKAFVVIILCCLGILIYSNTFRSSFHFDDERSIINKEGFGKGKVSKRVLSKRNLLLILKCDIL